MLKKFLVLAVTSGLAAKALKLWIDREHRQYEIRTQRDRAIDVQRWEDEGGNLAPAAQAAHGGR